jgi:hypothetical protein
VKGNWLDKNSVNPSWIATSSFSALSQKVPATLIVISTRSWEVYSGREAVESTLSYEKSNRLALSADCLRPFTPMIF